MSNFTERYGGTYISLAEASRRTGMSHAELLTAIDTGAIKSAEIGTSVFVDSMSLNGEGQAEKIPQQEQNSSRPYAKDEADNESTKRTKAPSYARERTTGPGRFVFEWRDALNATPILVIALSALVLAFPGEEASDTSAARVADAFFHAEEETRSATPTVALDEPEQNDSAGDPKEPTQPLGERADSFNISQAERSMLANALAASTEALRSFAHTLYDVFGIMDRD